MLYPVSLEAPAEGRFAIGSIVYFHPNHVYLKHVSDLINYGHRARVTGVRFTQSKVTYDLAMEVMEADSAPYFYDAITVKDVDSTFITDAEELSAEIERNRKLAVASSVKCDAISKLFALASNAKAFHGTSLAGLFGIVESNSLVLSQVAGKEAEQPFSKHDYFLSVRRGKFQPHAHYNAVIEFDASKLHAIMPREAVNYWGADAIHKHNEQEDRYYYKKPSVKNVLKMIRAVHIDVSHFDGERDGRRMRALIIKLVKLRIKVHLYADTKAYRMLDSRKAMPLSSLNYGGKPVSVLTRKLTEDELSSQSFRGRMHLRGKYSDAKFIVDTLYSGKAPIREEYDYVRNSFGYKMYATDMKHQMSSLLHNASHARGKEKQMAARIQDYMRKHSLNVEELAFKVREIIRKTDGKE